MALEVVCTRTKQQTRGKVVWSLSVLLILQQLPALRELRTVIGQVAKVGQRGMSLRRTRTSYFILLFYVIRIGTKRSELNFLHEPEMGGLAGSDYRERPAHLDGYS